MSVLKNPSAYEGKEPYVFVCYAHDDADIVYPEIIRLQNAGFRIWYDEGISPGLEWPETIARAIRDCSLFLCYVSPRLVISEHCRREINFAADRSD